MDSVEKGRFGHVCPRERIEEDAAKLQCERARIEESVSETHCAKAAIDRDVEDVACARAAIDSDVQAVECAKAAIDRDVQAVECAKAAINRDAEDVACARAAIENDVQAVECAKAAIEHDAGTIECARASIERDANAVVCKKAEIEKDAKDVCPRSRIEADAEAVCPKPAAPIIGIVPTQMPAEHLLRVNDYYINSIVLSGGVPLILPLTNDRRVYERLFSTVDGFVLTGGQDVDPERYGISPENPAYEGVGEITPMRDEVENLILSYAYRYDVPLLGICRGMQTMNVFFGGTLYVDLPREFDGRDCLTGEPIAHWQSEDPTETSHYIKVKRGSRLGQALGTHTAAANSFHHQGVNKVADNMTPVAYGADGLVEAIEATDRTFMLGVQWHPEFFLGEKHTGNLFSELVKESAAARRSGRLDHVGGIELEWMGRLASANIDAYM